MIYILSSTLTIDPFLFTPIASTALKLIFSLPYALTIALAIGWLDAISQ